MAGDTDPFLAVRKASAFSPKTKTLCQLVSSCDSVGDMSDSLGDAEDHTRPSSVGGKETVVATESLAYSLPVFATLNSGSAIFPQRVSLANVDAARVPTAGCILGNNLNNISGFSAVAVMDVVLQQPSLG